jgi:hypothetical protein
MPGQNNLSESALQDAVEQAHDTFPDSDPDPVKPCEAGGKSASAPSPCPAETLRANLAKCDGGTGIWDNAKAAAGKDPTVKVEGAAGGFGGHADLSGGGVVIAPNPDCCGATQTFVFELTNLSSKGRFQDVTNKVSAGDLGREEYTRAMERIEYDSGLNSVKAFDSCKKTWGCGDAAVARHGFVKAAKDFDDYYNTRLAKGHKDYYRNAWDSRYKAAYDKKHPSS